MHHLDHGVSNCCWSNNISTTTSSTAARQPWHCSHDACRDVNFSQKTGEHVAWGQGGSATDVNICSLTLYFFSFPQQVGCLWAGLHRSSQWAAVSRGRLFLSANELGLGRGPRLWGEAELCFPVTYFAWLPRREGNKGQSRGDFLTEAWTWLTGTLQTNTLTWEVNCRESLSQQCLAHGLFVEKNTPRKTFLKTFFKV